MILSGGDRYVGLVQLLALVGACLAIVGIARRLGFGSSAAVFGASRSRPSPSCCCRRRPRSTTSSLQRSSSACAYFAMGTLARGARTRRPRARPGGRHEGNGGVRAARRSRCSCSRASPVGGGWRSRRRAPSASQPARSGSRSTSRRRTSVTGGVVVDRGVQPLGERIWRSVADLLELSDGENTALLASPLWGLGALTVALVVALVLWRRSRVAAGVAVLVGAVAFVAAPDARDLGAGRSTCSQRTRRTRSVWMSRYQLGGSRTASSSRRCTRRTAWRS